MLCKHYIILQQLGHLGKNLCQAGNSWALPEQLSWATEYVVGLQQRVVCTLAQSMQTSSSPADPPIYSLSTVKVFYNLNLSYVQCK